MKRINHRIDLRTMALVVLSQVAAAGAGYAGIVRVRNVEGDVQIQKVEDSGYEALSSNTPIIEGDVVWTGSMSRAELQLESGSLARLDRSTEVEFKALGGRNTLDEAGQYFSADSVIRLWAGNIYLDSLYSTFENESVEIETPASSVALLGRGVYRIDIENNGDTRISVIDGAAEVSGRQGSVILRSGERTYVYVGYSPESPFSFNAYRTDTFDDWNATMTRRFERSQRYGDVEDLPQELSSYYSELDDYGTWRYSDLHQRTVWVPHVAVSWKPYYHGRWIWRHHRPVWVSYEPWGWAPYHYGRWSYSVSFGWYWLPDVVYAPAWVTWVTGPDYFAWCPLDPWGYPVVYSPYGRHTRHDSREGHRGRNRKYALDDKTWTAIRHDRLVNGDVRKYALSSAEIEVLQPARKVALDSRKIRSFKQERLKEWAREAYQAPENAESAWIPTKSVALSPEQRAAFVDEPEAEARKSRVPVRMSTVKPPVRPDPVPSGNARISRDRIDLDARTRTVVPEDRPERSARQLSPTHERGVSSERGRFMPLRRSDGSSRDEGELTVAPPRTRPPEPDRSFDRQVERPSRVPRVMRPGSDMVEQPDTLRRANPSVEGVESAQRPSSGLKSMFRRIIDRKVLNKPASPTDPGSPSDIPVVRSPVPSPSGKPSAGSIPRPAAAKPSKSGASKSQAKAKSKGK